MIERTPSPYLSRRIATLVPLAFAAGVPQGAFYLTLVIWLKEAGGATKEQIGLISLAAIPFSIKVLWAPLFDRYPAPFLGRRRGWMLIVQLALAAAMASLAIVDPRHFAVALGVAGAIAFLAATHDILVDAHRADVIPPDERGMGASVYVASYRVAMVAGSSLILVIAEASGWRLALVTCGLLVAVGCIGSFTAPEPDAAPDAPRTLAAAVVRPLVELFGRPRAGLFIAFVLSYKVGEVAAQPMIAYVQAGYALATIAAVNLVGVGAMVFGMLAAGAFIPRLGLLRSLLLFGALQAGANLGYALLTMVPGNVPLFAAVVAIDNMMNGLGSAAFVAYLMSLTNRAFSATQYALLICLVGLVGRLVGGASGWAAGAIGLPSVFALSAALAGPALLLIRWLPDDDAR